MEKHLHIIAFDVPYPADYGCVVDIFYTIQALHTAGIHIHLHCFEHDRGAQPELEQYCTEVIYYPRQCGHKGFSHKLPYIIGSRSNPELLTNLLKDNYPLLLEGIHCAYLLQDERFDQRKVFLRLHYVANQYYKELSRHTLSPFKKLYYLHESKLLKQYENAVAGKATIITINEQDAAICRHEFNAPQVVSLPAFLPFKEISSKEGIGCFCLYHGNLSAHENEKAALWLLRNVFNKLPVNFIIAGKDPSLKLEEAIGRQPHACLVANPTEQEMQDLISQAHIHVLPSLYRKTVHIKLLNALFNGRHCIVNDEMIKDSVLAPSCHVATTPQAFQSIIMQLKNKPFEDHEMQLRRYLLQQYFNTVQNTQKLVSLIWN